MTNNFDTQPNSLTPITHPQIQDIIAHINEEHTEDLADLMRVSHRIDDDILQSSKVELVKVYSQGFDIQLIPNNKSNQHSVLEFMSSSVESVLDSDLDSDSDLNLNTSTDIYFIAFESPIRKIEDLSLQYILLKQKADKKIGKKTIKLTDKFFEVKDSYYVTDNMFRLVLSPLAYKSTPENEPGYAYLFDLATFNNEENDRVRKSDGLNSKNLTSLNNDSKPQNNSLKQSKDRQHCYYTLRKAWHDNQEGDRQYAWVDIFIHGDTPGARWALNLKPDDIIKTKREIPEKLAHLNALNNDSNLTSTATKLAANDKNAQTRCLLIADETSIPTVARLLELWQQPIAPLIICVTQDAADQHYLEQVDLSSTLNDKPIILPIYTGADGDSNAGDLDTLATRIDACLANYLAQNPLSLNRVWGALEANVTKQLRRLLQQRLGLTRSEVVIKVYWRR